MKKAILTIGLFTLVLASTSFAAPKNALTVIAGNTIFTPIDGSGGQDAGGNRKHDDFSRSITVLAPNMLTPIDGSGGQDAGGNRKHD